MNKNSARHSAAYWWMAALAMTLASGAAAQNNSLSGKAVVDTVCTKCHASGAGGAPRIGDNAAWRTITEQGLDGLTQRAVNGVRRMPAHGGSAKLTNLEISRAISYMVNQSGGKWKEPASTTELTTDRTGQQVVLAQCGRCHQDGLQGAPRIGDRDAWVPRLMQGLDYAVRSAIRGHGGMPPRGDQADLTDFEVRNAIYYMYNPDSAERAGTSAPGGK